LHNDKLKNITCHHRQGHPIECEYPDHLKHSTQYTLHLRATGEMTKRGEHLNYSVRVNELKDDSLAFQKVIIRYACAETFLISINGIPTPSGSKITRAYLPAQKAALGQKNSIELMTSKGDVIDTVCTIGRLRDEGLACLTDREQCSPPKPAEPHHPVNPSPQPQPVTPIPPSLPKTAHTG
jgi:hypothetical protein